MPVTWPGAPPVRLMGNLGLHGIRRVKSPGTTHSVPQDQCPADLVRRHLEVFAPGGLWVAGIPPQAGGALSYVRTFSGWVYVAFVTDVYSRRIIGWQTTCRPVSPTWLWMPSRWPSGNGNEPRPASRAWCTARDRGVQVHSLSAGSVRLRGGRISRVERGTPMTMPWLRR